MRFGRTPDRERAVGYPPGCAWAAALWMVAVVIALWVLVLRSR